ncbi:hypothetical protein [Stenotrophomonas rhizophila]|uniref:hypothetical protein n=1 Tax=Stenotrophomonas rhizophila TaxID=216778 RepID=UPI0011AB0F58|nr:hypothetical protein [Stenotrophomonas rhizophila]
MFSHFSKPRTAAIIANPHCGLVGDFLNAALLLIRFILLIRRFALLASLLLLLSGAVSAFRDFPDTGEVLLTGGGLLVAWFLLGWGAAGVATAADRLERRRNPELAAELDWMMAVGPLLRDPARPQADTPEREMELRMADAMIAGHNIDDTCVRRMAAQVVSEFQRRDRAA